MVPAEGFCRPTDGLQKMWECIARGQHLMCPKCARARGVLARDMLCEGCAEMLPAKRFSKEMQDAWTSDAICRFVCTKCEGHLRARDAEFCTGCEREWLISAFDAKELRP